MTNVKAPPKVSDDFKHAVYDDWKRQAVDSAKKRAVAQVSDYDTFKNMVSVAHLQPIGAGKKSQDVSVMPAISVGRDGSFIRQKELHDTLPWERETVLASTFSDFKRAWRRNHTSKEQRLQYLQQYTPQHLQQIFRVEIDGMLLNEIIDVLLSGWEEHKACHTMDQMDNDTRSAIHDGTWNVDGKLWVLSCLNAVRHAGQFSTTCMLVPSKTITRLQIFFQDLALKCELDHKWKSQISNIISNGDDLVGLAHLFRVTVL